MPNGVRLFAEDLRTALQKKYRSLTVKHAVGTGSEKHTNAKDIFVDVHLEKYSTKVFSEKVSHDLKEKETRVQSSEEISIEKLFSKLDEDDVHKTNVPPKLTTLGKDTSGKGMLDEDHMTKAPAKIFFQGGPGAGKTVLMNHMARQWTEGEIWTNIQYVFAIDMKGLSPEEKWTLSDLLFGDLNIPTSVQFACLDEILAHPERVVILMDSFDEFSGFEYSPRRLPNNRSSIALSTLISAVIGDKVLPGAKVVVASRPSKKSITGVFDHVVHVSGLTIKSIDDYVRKFTDTEEEAAFMKKNIDKNNMSELCRVPLQCSIVCELLRDMYANAKVGESPKLKTTTDLYIQVTQLTASKAHPHTKDNPEKMEVDRLYDVIEEPLRKHARLAIFGMLSSKCFFDRKDLDKFGFSDEDINCGFLRQSQSGDKRLKEAVTLRWTFTHATVFQFFGALGVLAVEEDEWERVQKSTMDEQLMSMICFLAGLLGDSEHAEFANRFMQKGKKLDIRKMITEVTGSLKDDAVTISAVFETQNDDMVDIIRPEIESSSMSAMDVRALEWVLEKEEYCITSLK